MSQLFSEREMLDAVGVSQAEKALSEVELGRKVLHRKYDDSVVTTVTIEESDWEDKSGYSSLKKLYLTPKDGYEARRRELSDMFPMAIVVDTNYVPGGLRSAAFRNLTLLFKGNYAVLPIRKKRKYDSIFSGCNPFSGVARELFRYAKVVDLFIGGEIVTDKCEQVLGTRNMLSNLTWSSWFNDIVEKSGSKFETVINRIEEVLS